MSLSPDERNALILRFVETEPIEGALRNLFTEFEARGVPSLPDEVYTAMRTRVHTKMSELVEATLSDEELQFRVAMQEHPLFVSSTAKLLGNTAMLSEFMFEEIQIAIERAMSACRVVPAPVEEGAPAPNGVLSVLPEKTQASAPFSFDAPAGADTPDDHSRWVWTNDTPDPNRPETGTMRFGDDWTGVFLRGDYALVAGATLLEVAERLDEADIKTAIERGMIKGLGAFLQSCALSHEAGSPTEPRYTCLPFSACLVPTTSAPPNAPPDPTSAS